LSEREPGTRASWKRKIDRKLVQRILAIAAGMFLVGYAVMAFGMVITAPRRTVITVPDVRWMPDRQARRVLEAADLTMEIRDSIPNPTVEAGAVIAQTPLPSEEVGPGSRVRVILSSGPQQRVVPDVSALSRDQASRVLTASGFSVVVALSQNPAAAGRVLGTEPASGARLPISSTVRLLVSAGPPIVVVPTIVGAREVQLAGILDAAGLRLGKVNHVFDLDGPAGVVLSQNPSPGDSIRMGAAIDAVISTDQLPGVPVDEVHREEK
jgi:serine/threonine-protein kinase